MKAYYLFEKTPLPATVSGELELVSKQLQAASTQRECLRLAHNIITHRYHGSRFKTAFKLFDLVSSGWQDLWNKPGFLYCTNQNYLLSLLLVRSRLFREADIRQKWTRMWYLGPHQYLEIRVNESWIAVDCWARHYGIPLGQHAYGFNTTIFKSFAE